MCHNSGGVSAKTPNRSTFPGEDASVIAPPEQSSRKGKKVSGQFSLEDKAEATGLVL